METLINDVRHGCRLLFRNPGLTFVVIFGSCCGNRRQYRSVRVMKALLLVIGIIAGVLPALRASMVNSDTYIAQKNSVLLMRAEFAWLL